MYECRFVTAGHSQYVLFNVDVSKCTLTYLEHVVLSVSLEVGGATQRYRYSDYFNLGKTELNELIRRGNVRRGDVSISLVSPYGTVSHLLPKRPKDFVNAEGFRNWPFMSVRHWGESPEGEWLVNISYTPYTHSRGYVILTSSELKLYGTVHPAEAVLTIPHQCDQQCQGACGGQGPFLCDVCKSVRNAATLECIDSCSENSRLQGNYCIPPSRNYSHTIPVTIFTPAEMSSVTAEALFSNTSCSHSYCIWSIYLFIFVLIL